MGGVTWAQRVARAGMLPALLLVAGGLTACGHDTAQQAADPAASGGAPSGSASVPSGEFLSTSVTHGGAPRPLVSGTHISLAFANGQIRASGGCNTMSGPVTFRDNTIVVTELAQTDMGCLTGGLTEQDQFVAEFLTAKPAYTYDGTTLDLKTPDTEIVFGPKKSVQPDLPLEGTRWDITHVTSGPAAGSTDSNAAVGASVAPPDAYLKFAEGKVSGNDGCNSFSGDATIGTDTVTFGPIVSTKRACPSTHDDGVLAVLSGTVSWRIDHTVLTLTNPSGAGLQLSADEGSTPNAGTPSPGAAGGAPVVTPPCCKPLVTPGVGSSGGATGTGGAPTTVNTAGPADPPPGY